MKKLRDNGVLSWNDFSFMTDTEISRPEVFLNIGETLFLLSIYGQHCSNIYDRGKKSRPDSLGKFLEY